MQKKLRLRASRVSLAVKLIPLLILFTLLPVELRAADEIYRSQVSTLIGTSQITTTRGSTTSPGIYLGYHYFLTDNYAIKGAYQYASNLSGLNLGLEYCLFGRCTPVKKSVGDVLEVTEYGTWGLTVGAGVAQRYFQVSTGTVTTVGFSAGLGLSRTLSRTLRLQGELETTLLSYGSQSIQANTYSLGLTYVFGN